MKMKKYICFFAALFAAFTIRAEQPECPLDTINGEEVYRYTVEKSIGLYRIGVNFNVPQSEIIRLNPQLKERGLHYAETLYIPTGRKVEAKPKQEARHMLAAQPIIKRDTVVIVDTIVRVETIVLRDSLATTDSLAGDSSLVADTTAGNTRRVLELAMMLPFESRQTKRSANAERMMEFYQGALLALHELQSDSVLYRLRVYDTERSDRRVAALCDTACHELDSVQGIIGLAYPVQIDRMGEWCQAHNVPLLLPFTDDVDLTSNPQLMQFNSTDAREAEAVCQWISRRDTSNLRCVVVDAREAEIAGSVRELRDRMKKESITTTSTTIHDILSDSVFTALAADKQNLIILHSDKYNRVRTMIPYIEQCFNRGYDIVLLSQYSWQREDIRLPQIYTSVFTGGVSQVSYDSLWNKYFSPDHVAGTPRFDLLGYDLMNALILRLQGEMATAGLQSDITWEQVGEQGGWQNTNVRVVEK